MPDHESIYRLAGIERAVVETRRMVEDLVDGPVRRDEVGPRPPLGARIDMRSALADRIDMRDVPPPVAGRPRPTRSGQGSRRREPSSSGDAGAVGGGPVPDRRPLGCGACRSGHSLHDCPSRSARRDGDVEMY